MGEIVGAALVAHVPTMVLPEEVRRELNGGEEISLVPGLRQLAEEKIRPLEPDTIVVFDSHWFTTVEHVVTSHDRRHGIFTSSELPRGMRQVPYDIPGDRQLAEAWAAQADGRNDTWVTAIDDPYLPIYYATTNLLGFCQGDREAWVSASICQTGQPDDFLLLGQLLAATVADLDRRVVVLASGGLSHRFWPLRQLRARESSKLENIRTPEAAAFDLGLLELMKQGDHAAIIDAMDDFSAHGPEGRFGHYLAMLGAMGGSTCTATGTQYGDYEAAIGTGQAHVWFDL